MSIKLHLERGEQNPWTEEKMLRTFDKAHFFNHLENAVLKFYKPNEKWPTSQFEYFVVEYFSNRVFNGKQFFYVPKFAEAIREFQLKYLSNISFISNSSLMEESPNKKLLNKSLRKYLILVYPLYNPYAYLQTNLKAYETFLKRTTN
jgi:hypothetical protein